MTEMEQGLRYIHNEVQFMVRDPSGGNNHINYADRVIMDSTGVKNFCSRVMASENPLAVILKALKESRGDFLLKFFNVSLHDTRIDLVSVLAECNRVRKMGGSRSAYEYLYGLYAKAVKRMAKLITGINTKDGYKSMYRGLHKFAKLGDKENVYYLDPDDDGLSDFDDLDLDDLDLDDDDDFEYEGDDQFHDIEYAMEVLEAYRNGNEPPQRRVPTSVAKYLDPSQGSITLTKEEYLSDMKKVAEDAINEFIKLTVENIDDEDETVEDTPVENKPEPEHAVITHIDPSHATTSVVNYAALPTTSLIQVRNTVTLTEEDVIPVTDESEEPTPEPVEEEPPATPMTDVFNV